ncbi:MAG: hypothetical protein HY900_02310, partial [Deltaproteobacteria bacterium]|nr:hypothetical protein [Deltaproteobacteria bacterium]
MRSAILAFLPALLLSPASASPATPVPVTGLSLLGRAVLPRDLEVEGARVGGLSGLTWDETSGRFLA